MKFRLIFKQSLRSFYGKIGLYLTFTIFLIISLAMIVGLFGFSYGFDKTIKDSLGHVRLNQQYNFSNAYVPTWVIKDQGTGDEVAKLDPGNHFWEQEVNNQITEFLISEFGEAFPENMGPYTSENLINPKNDNQLQLALLTLGLGYHWGNIMWPLQEDDAYNNQLLYHYFSTLEIKIKSSSTDDVLRANLKIYNQLINQLRPTFSEKNFTNNVGMAIFLNKFKNQPNKYQIASGNQKSGIFYSPIYNKPGVNLKYQRLNRNSNLVRYKPELIDSTPRLLFSNEASPFNIIEELKTSDFSKYKTFIDDYRYTYVPPKFLKKYHLNLGDKITIYHQNDNALIEPIDLVIVGTMAEIYQFNDEAEPNFTIPYQWAYKYQLKNSTDKVTLAQNFAPFDAGLRLYNSEFKNENITAQKEAAKLFLNYFDALRSEDEERFYSQISSVAWIKSQLQSSYDMAIGLFYTLAAVLSILLIILLFVVFYFITREIISIERNTLFYLKAMGVYNSGLSVLTTFAMLVPIIIGIIGGFFVALAIQKMVSDIALDRSVLTFNFFTFNFSFILSLLISIIIIIIGFYAINFYFLRSPALANPTARKPGFLARGLIKTKTKIDTHLSRKIRISLAFAFKNIYKNIVTFFILAITFGLILYIVQFQSSLNTIARAYENWNLPYKSVLYQPRLAPIIEESEDYERSYEVITEDQINSLKPINIAIGDDPYAELKAVINLYVSSLEDSSIKFNWADYYFTKDFSKNILEIIGPNPTDDQINSLIDLIAGNNAPRIDYRVRGQIITIIKQIAKQNNTLKNDFGYNEGYNIFFGKVLTPPSSPKRNVLTIRTINPANDAQDIKSILFENDLESRSHYDFRNSITADNYIQPGTYSIAKESGEAIKIKDPLRVGISSYLQTNFDLHIGDIVSIRLDGFKTDATFDGYRGDNSALIYAYISHVIRGDTIQDTFFTSQIGVLNYLAQGNHVIEQDDNFLVDSNQTQYYGQLLNKVESNQTTLSNTVFTSDMDIPYGIRNITLPFYKKTDPNKVLGSRIEDFYSDKGALQKYLNSFEDNIAVFHLVTSALYSKTEQFISILVRFVIILTLFALTISLLLITLVLLENRKIISVLKALGYRRIEITGYLISGYLVSTVLAVLASIGLSFLAFFLTKRPISQYLGMSVYYLFSWQFFLLAIFLGVIFAGLMAISIAVFTRYQNPKNAFISA